MPQSLIAVATSFVFILTGLKSPIQVHRAMLKLQLQPRRIDVSEYGYGVFISARMFAFFTTDEDITVRCEALP